MRYLLLILFFASAVSEYVLAQTVNGSVMRLVPSTLSATCNPGDLRTDVSDSYKLKQCGSGNIWSEISGTGDAVSLQGVPVSTVPPTANQVLTYNGTIHDWEAQDAQAPLPAFTTQRVLYGDGTSTPTTSSGFTFNSGTGALTATSFIGALTGNVTGSVTGNVTGALTGNASTASALAADPTDCASNTYANAIAASGNLTCASVTNAATTATATNTNSTIVLRDGSGNFSAGTITAALTGNASTASTVTTNANLTGPITSVGNATSIASQTGTGTKFVVDTSPTLITPNLGTPTTLVGTNISGTAASLTAGTVTTNANLTGDVTSVGNATTIGATKVTNAMLAGSIAASKLIGSDIATVGTITSGTWNGTAVDAAHGGTGQTSYAVGDILYASASNVLSKLSGTVYGSVLKFIGGLPAWVYPNNFILNDSATADTTGWATYADAAGTSPVDCTGGSPSSTWTRTTSNPLSRDGGSFLFTHSANNRQGEGFSYAFNVDRASSIAPKVQNVEFDYEVASGTFQTGSTSTDSDIEWWIVDTTSGALIQPSTYKIYSQQGKFIASFQNNVNSASYRICGHVATTNAVAYTFKAANFKIWPSRYTYGSPFTAVTAFTPTGAWSTNTTYTGFEHFEGQFAVYDILISLAGAPTSATLTVNLPSGRTIDTAALTKSSANFGEIDNLACGGAATGVAFKCAVVYNSTTAVSLYSHTLSTFTGTQPVRYTAVTQASPATFANGDYIRLAFRVPIVGKNSTVQMSDSAPQSVIAFKGANTAGTSISNSGSLINVPFATTVYDTTGGWNGTQYRVSVPGKYRVNVVAGFPAAVYAVGNIIQPGIYLNNAIANYGAATVIQTTNSQLVQVAVSTTLDCVAGDLLEFRTSNNRSAGATSIDTSPGLNHIDIERVSGPVTIGATETVAARYYNATATVTSSFSNVTFSTKDYDTHGAYSGATYTCKSPGKYDFVGSVFVSATTITAGQNVGLILSKSGSTSNMPSVQWVYQGTNTTNQTVPFNFTNIQCNDGDTINIQISATTSSPVVVSNNNNNVFTAKRVGN